jgi:two-component system sensor histidine kinase HydH
MVHAPGSCVGCGPGTACSSRSQGVCDGWEAMLDCATAGILARAIAHDVNNLLTCIALCASIGAGQRDDADVQESLLTIRDATLQAASLLATLRSSDWTVGSSGDGCRVDELLGFVGRLFERVGQRSRVGVSVRVCAARAAIRPVELQQVLVNLGLNAIEAMPAGGQLSFVAGEDAGQVSIEVEDDGPGIPAELRGRLFELGASSKVHRGVGLSVVKNIVERRGGSVTVASDAGRGTRFTVRLPRAGTA